MQTNRDSLKREPAMDARRLGRGLLVTVIVLAASSGCKPVRRCLKNWRGDESTLDVLLDRTVADISEEPIKAEDLLNSSDFTLVAVRDNRVRRRMFKATNGNCVYKFTLPTRNGPNASYRATFKDAGMLRGYVANSGILRLKREYYGEHVYD